MSKRLNVLVENCGECPHATFHRWHNDEVWLCYGTLDGTQKPGVLGPDTPDTIPLWCPLPDDVPLQVAAHVTHIELVPVKEQPQEPKEPDLSYEKKLAETDDSDVLVIDVDGCQYRAKVITVGKMALSGLVFTRPMAEQISKVLAHFARTGELPTPAQAQEPEHPFPVGTMIEIDGSDSLWVVDKYDNGLVYLRIHDQWPPQYTMSRYVPELLQLNPKAVGSTEI